MPLARRLLVAPSAAVGMLLVAVICLGPERALRDFGAGFEQVLNVPLAPERVRAFFALLQAEGFWMAMGVLATKLAIFNLLPLPPMPGFLLLSEVVSRLRGKEPSEASSLMLWGLLPTLAVSSRTISSRPAHNPGGSCQPDCSTGPCPRCSEASRASSLRSAPLAPLDPSSARGRGASVGRKEPSCHTAMPSTNHAMPEWPTSSNAFTGG
jgi:hypothetical protein